MKHGRDDDVAATCARAFRARSGGGGRAGGRAEARTGDDGTRTLNENDARRNGRPVGERTGEIGRGLRILAQAALGAVSETRP